MKISDSLKPNTIVQFNFPAPGVIGFTIPALSIRTGHGGGGTQSCLTLSDLWTSTHQAPQSKGFSGQE